MGHCRYSFYVLSLVFVVLVLSPLAAAIGITPAVVEASYGPDSPQTWWFQVTGNQDEPVLSFGGELAQYVLDSRVYNDQGWKAEVTFTTPDSLAPGGHELMVIVGEKPVQGYGQPMMGARVEVGARITVYVPADKKFLSFRDFEWDLRTNRGVNTYYAIYAVSIGKETISSVTAKAIIKPDFEGAEVVEIPFTSAQNVEFNDKVILRGEWVPPINQPYGNYKIAPTITWDGETITPEPYAFTVGDLELEIMDISPVEFETTKISSAELSVRSFWSSPVQYIVKFKVLNSSGAELIDFSSPPSDVRPISTGTITVYLDASKIPVGEYMLAAEVMYHGKSAVKAFPIKIVTATSAPSVPLPSTISSEPDEDSSDSGPAIILAIAAAIIVVALVLFIIRRRKEKYDEV